MEVYLIRHGATAGNLEHRYVGVTDEELTVEAAEELKLNRCRYPVPELVFASPLKRCIQTAGLLFPGMPVQVLDGLQECAFGDFECKNYQELQGDARYQAWIDSNGTLAFPGGESRAEFAARCQKAFLQGYRIACEQKCRSAAFVVHGGTIMALLDAFSVPHQDYFHWQVKNTRGYSGTLTGIDENIKISDLKPLPGSTDVIGIEQQFVMKKNKKLRCGYTTGSCAAAAAKGAAQMLLTGRLCQYSDIMTPKRVALHLPLLEQTIEEGFAQCAVRKYGGDDPDATDGILVYARAERLPGPEQPENRCGKLISDHVDNQDGTKEPHVDNSGSPVDDSFLAKNYGGTADHQSRRDSCSIAAETLPRVEIHGGTGVGRVTKPGLEQPVGAAAINRVPREMITHEVLSVCEEYEYAGRIKITISVPAGVEIGKRTFNPHIGIMGGISILGTKGIVVPMSEEALIASIRVEMKQKLTQGEENLLITPGNYGADFIRRKELSQALDAEHSMKCSNYVGETLDMAVELGVKGILFVAHIGKFIKVSGGVMNTHSAHADCRAELMAAQAMRAGADARTVQALLDTNTTEEAVGILKEAGILEAAMAETVKRIKFHLQKRCQNSLATEVILFSNQFGYLGETDGAEALMEQIIVQNNHTVT